MVKIFPVFVPLSLLLVFSATAEVKQPMVREAVMDTSMQKMRLAAEKAEQPEMRGKEYSRDLKYEPWERIREREHDEWGQWRHEPMSMGMMFHPMRHPMMLPAFICMFCFFAWLLINILLTILVSLDMARRRQFNGLWIPVLLLMGIPGTGLYALFRIGDNIFAKEQKT
jgi:hypothetical protein